MNARSPSGPQPDAPNDFQMSPGRDLITSTDVLCFDLFQFVAVVSKKGVVGKEGDGSMSWSLFLPFVCHVGISLTKLREGTCGRRFLLSVIVQDKKYRS